MFYLILLCEIYVVLHSSVEAAPIDNVSGAKTSDLHTEILFLDLSFYLYCVVLTAVEQAV